MYYDTRPQGQQNNYKDMLHAVGMLSNLFSTSKKPFLSSRAHENIFAKFFNIKNCARADRSADAVDHKQKIGIGLKTWISSDGQKIAEFNKLRPDFKDLQGIDLITFIAKHRNSRIQITKNAYGLNSIIYHIIKRFPSEMRIYELPMDEIDIPKIKQVTTKDNSVYFSDGKHKYWFNLSKSTLFMDFSDMEELDKISVSIVKDPYAVLSDLLTTSKYALSTFTQNAKPAKDQLCLRLYSKGHIVHKSSGLNQWNGYRGVYRNHVLVRKDRRDPDELYIPYPAEDRACKKNFFPPRNQKFKLLLPNGTTISAKVCQQGGKAIMSDPNKALGHWLLRDVFNLPMNTPPITYDMLKQFGVDSVLFTKLGKNRYSIEFCTLGTYERFNGLEDEGDEEEDA